MLVLDVQRCWCGLASGWGRMSVNNRLIKCLVEKYDGFEYIGHHPWQSVICYAATSETSLKCIRLGTQAFVA